VERGFSGYLLVICHAAAPGAVVSLHEVFRDLLAAGRAGDGIPSLLGCDLHPDTFAREDIPARSEDLVHELFFMAAGLNAGLLSYQEARVG